MQSAPAETSSPAAAWPVLRLTVRHHPGALLHVCSLLQRRNFRTGAFLCLPDADGRHCRVLVQLHERERLGQVVAQLEKLEDVMEVDHDADGAGHFERLAGQMS